MTLRLWWLSVTLLCAMVVAAVAGLVVVGRVDGGEAGPAAAGTLPVAVRRIIPVAEASKPAPKPERVTHLTMMSNSVAIPDQHVRAPVIGYCPIIEGGLEPPSDVHEVCYWAGGAAVGADAGTTVLAGHINWAGVTGAFGNLAALHRGDLILTVGAGARQFEQWRVARVEHRPKTQGIDRAAFVGQDGPRRLYLISCGGAFDAYAASYLDNIYVLAKPVPEPPPPPPAPKPRPVE
jgi:hypothetical protein